MAGILDNKSRVVDAIITREGRRQIASGMLRANFISFTDRNVVYSKDSDGYLEDPGLSIYFEASSNNDDSIIPETSFDGDMLPFSTNDFETTNGRVPGQNLTGSVQVYESISSSSIDSFRRQMIIGSRDTLRVQLDYGFRVGVDNTEFYITDSLVSQSNGISRAYVDDIECVFQDYRFGNFDNYKFMPPLDRPIDESIAPKQMATYTQINENPLDTLEELQKYLAGKQVSEIRFTNTSDSNNLVSQVFEHGTNGVMKLAVVDGGQFEGSDGKFQHVFFAGKLYRDTAQNLNFVNIFTMVFE